MNILEKILEEIEEVEKEYVTGHKVLYALGATGMATEISHIIRSHIDEVENGGWIPVEERLPEEGTGQLIVTDKGGNVYMNITYGYAEDDDKEPTFHRWDEEWWYCYKYRVVAWRLKPEPYIKNPK